MGRSATCAAWPMGRSAPTLARVRARPVTRSPSRACREGPLCSRLARWARNCASRPMGHAGLLCERCGAGGRATTRKGYLTHTRRCRTHPSHRTPEGSAAEFRARAAPRDECESESRREAAQNEPKRRPRRAAMRARVGAEDPSGVRGPLRRPASCSRASTRYSLCCPAPASTGNAPCRLG
jgi:hypothetical protein